MTQHARAELFHRLHAPDADGILVLPNAWDAMSARMVEEAGARAIATTSAGVSWALGRRDGHGLAREDMLDVVRRIVATVRVPVTADVEGGYGAGTANDVAETVRGVIGAGAVGINLEDTSGSDATSLIGTFEQAKRISAARKAAEAEGVRLYINARTDAYLYAIGAPEGRFDESERRARIFMDAGASGVFVPGVIDAPTIGHLASAIAAPLNILAAPGAPSIAELKDLGVARVSVGGALARSVMAHVRDAARELFQQGTYDALRGGIPFSEANGFFPAIE